MSLVEVIVTLIGITMSAFIGYLGLRLRSRADAVVEKNVAQGQENIAQGRVYTGYGDLLQRNEADNARLRLEMDELRTEMRERLAAVELRCAQDKAELTNKLAAANEHIVELLATKHRDEENKKVTEKLNGKPLPPTEAP